MLASSVLTLTLGFGEISLPPFEPDFRLLGSLSVSTTDIFEVLGLLFTGGGGVFCSHGLADLTTSQSSSESLNDITSGTFSFIVLFWLLNNATN